MSLTDRLEAYLRQRSNQWIDGRELGTVAGAYAWRSRCADLRKRGLTIENRQRKVGHYKVSEYRLVLPEPQQSSLFREQESAA